MTAVQFYHLMTTPLEQALPQLMEKAVEANMRVIIRAADEIQLARLNDHLWSYKKNSFLPHGTEKDPLPEQQPIYLTTGDEAPNAANALVITDGRVNEQFDGIEKLLDVFDGHNDDSVIEARKRWKHYKESGHDISYYQQQKGSGWKKMA